MQSSKQKQTKMQKKHKIKSSLASQSPKSSGCSSGSDASASFSVDNKGNDHFSFCKWIIPNFPNIKDKAKVFYGPYFQVGGFNFRLGLYPEGASVLGFISPFVEIDQARKVKLDCFANVKMVFVNHLEDSKSLHKEVHHRFSVKRDSIGWFDFAVSSAVLEEKAGFLNENALHVCAYINILDEVVVFSSDNSEDGSVSHSRSGVYAGKFSWKIRNFSLFEEIIKTQKILSPSFKIGSADYQLSSFISTNLVDGDSYLSLFVESNAVKNIMEKRIYSFMSGMINFEFRKSNSENLSFWGFFGISVLNQKPGLDHIHRNSQGRFDICAEDDLNLGWLHYMKMTDFTKSEKGFLVDDTVLFSVSFHVVEESFSGKGIPSNPWLFEDKNTSLFSKFDPHVGEFYWNIQNFTWLKDIMKKKKMTGICVESRKMGIRKKDLKKDFVMAVYPRGQSYKPSCLPLYLDVSSSPGDSSNWSGLVYYRLGILNQKDPSKSITKEALIRCSRDTKDLGCVSITLANYFDQNSGYIVEDTAVFYARIYILNETFIVKELTDTELCKEQTHIESDGKRKSITWVVDNFLAYKELASMQKVFSIFFKVAEFEFRIGVLISVDSVYIFLDCDPSLASDPDENLWVCFRIALVNQKDPAKSLWKKSTFCTKTCKNYDFHSMKLCDILEPDAGYVVNDYIIFACEILDYCPWFEFSNLEVLACDEDNNATLSHFDKPLKSYDTELTVERKVDIFTDLISRAVCRLMHENNHPRPLVVLREELHLDVYTLAAILLRLRFHLESDRMKVLLHPSNFHGSGELNIITVKSLPSSEHSMAVIKFLQQKIDDIVLDIIIECQQSTIKKPSLESCNSSSFDSMASNKADYQLELQRHIGDAGFVLCIILRELGCDEEIKCSSLNIDTTVHTIVERLVSLLGTFTHCPLGTQPAAASKAMTQQSNELFGVIVDLLKPLSRSVALICPEPPQEPQLGENISFIMDRARLGTQPYVVVLLHKLVSPLEYPLVVCKLLDQIENLDAEPAHQSHPFAAISQSQSGRKLWEFVFSQILAHLVVSNGETLGIIIRLLLRSATQCKRIPQAVKSVCARLKEFGIAVPTYVLNLLSKSINCCDEIGEAMLREINSGFDMDDQTGDYKELNTEHQFSNIYMLMDLLSVPSLAVEAAKAFEKGVAHGFIVDHLLVRVLEMHLSQISKDSAIYAAQKYQYKGTSNFEDIDLAILVGLAETLSISEKPQVCEFVRKFYVILFKLFAGDNYRETWLRELVDNAIIRSNNCQNKLDILLFLVHGENDIAKQVVSMMREAIKLANANCASLWHQLSAIKDENTHKTEELRAEMSSLNNEKDILLERLSESKASICQCESKMRSELDQFAEEKEHFLKHVEGIENQLKLFCCERDEIIAMFSMEKKGFQDSICNAEMKLEELKHEICDRMKVVVEEKNILAQSLMNAQAERKKLDRKLKRYSLDVVLQEKWCESLLSELWRLEQAFDKSETDRQEKEAEVAYFKARVNQFEGNLTACQQKVHSLEASLQKEILTNAQLYGMGLEDLSMEELEKLSHIHEEGLKAVHSLQHQRACSTVVDRLPASIIP